MKKVYVIVLSTLVQIIGKIYLLIYFEFIDDFGSSLPYDLSTACLKMYDIIYHVLFYLH